MSKSQAQIDKKKRETEKRKKLEKTILKIASEMPDDPVAPPQAKPTLPSKKPQS